jgi:DNA-directed RNA polymerase specialized sigma24 family protein
VTRVAAPGHEQLDAALLEMLQAFVARAPLFAELRARGEAEDLVQDALIAVGQRVRDGDVADPFAYATRVVQNLARRAYARAQPMLAVDSADLGPAGLVGDVAEAAEWRFELAEVLAMVRAVTSIIRELPPADVELVRAELRRDDQRALASRLGMSRATFYRRKRDVLCGFVSAVARRASTEPCPDRVEALLAAAGGSGFASARRAREHAESCVQCEMTLRHLAAARHGLAVLAPLPALVVRDGAGAERLAAGMHGGWDWLRGIVVRGPDPSVALPVSKNAAAALAAACVGVGGTTYCAVDGVPAPVRDALGITGHSRHVARPAPKRARHVRVPRAAVAAAHRGLAGRAPGVGRGATPQAPRVATTRAPVRGVAEAEFEGAGAAHKARAAEFRAPARPRAVATSAPSAPPPPAPDPAQREFKSAGSGGEFG